ncbi:MAG: hypothetical protein Q8O67_32400 [Deltaproteobacteria bacterium]|nr:hypothetical protein [Deltaproteobacteria bacterium]
MSVDEALLRGLLAAVVVVGGVFGLAALESVLLRPERGVLSTFSRARAQLMQRSQLSSDGVAGIAGLIVALLGPAVAAAFLSTSTSLSALAAAALLLTVPAPVLVTLGTANDERGRLALHDALAQLTRRALAIVAVVTATGSQSPHRHVVVVVVAAFAILVLVRSRHRGAPTAQPRFDDRLAGPALVVFRVTERAVVVVVAALGAAAVFDLSGSWLALVVTPLAVVGGGVVMARSMGTLRGEGVGGPLFLLMVASVGRAALSLLD